MNILITTGIFPPDIGGPATYVKNIADEFTRQDHIVRVITYSNQKMEDKEEYEIFRIKRGRNKLWRYLKYFFTVLRRASWADVIYVQDAVSAGLPTVYANIFLRKKIVLKVVGDYAWEQAQNQFDVRDDLDAFQHQKYDNRIEFWRRVQKFVAKKSAAIITPSEYLKKIVKCWGESDEKIKVIYNSFNEPEEIGENIDVPDGEIIFTAGRLVPWKGIDTLIKIMPRIIEKRPEAKFLIAGDGPEREGLQNLIVEKGLEDKVKLLGRIEHSKLLGYLKKSNLFILNSSYEGLSHQILEAMWTGVPIAVSCVGGNPEVIENEKSGLLFEYNNRDEIIDAAVKILSNNELANQFSENALRKLKQFSFDDMVKKTLFVLKKDV